MRSGRSRQLAGQMSVASFYESLAYRNIYLPNTLINIRVSIP